MKRCAGWLIYEGASAVIKKYRAQLKYSQRNQRKIELKVMKAAGETCQPNDNGYRLKNHPRSYCNCSTPNILCHLILLVLYQI